MWRKENSTLFYCFKPSFNLDDFDKNEDFELKKTFYEDQINQRVMFVAEEIDEEYEEDRSLGIARLQDAENSLKYLSYLIKTRWSILINIIFKERLNLL